MLFLALQFQMCVLPKGGQGSGVGLFLSNHILVMHLWGVGGDKNELHSTPVGVQQTEEKDELYMRVCVCLCVCTCVLLNYGTSCFLSDVQTGVPFC